MTPQGPRPCLACCFVVTQGSGGHLASLVPVPATVRTRPFRPQPWARAKMSNSLSVVEFKALIQRALAVRSQFAVFEARNYGREWTTEDLTLGLMKDVGDLAALVQASEGVRQAEGADVGKAVRHELSDCLWSVIVLADRLGIDLEAAFTQTMDDLGSQLPGSAS